MGGVCVHDHGVNTRVWVHLRARGNLGCSLSGTMHCCGGRILHVHVCVWAHMVVCEQGSCGCQRLTPGVFLGHTPFYISRQIFNPELTGAAVLGITLGPLTPFMSPGITDKSPHHPALIWGLGIWALLFILCGHHFNY